MKILLLAAALFSALSAAPASPGEKTDLQELFRSLDRVIARSGEYTARRESRIDSLKRALARDGLSLRERFDLTERLAENYNSYQSDFALLYLRRSLALAEETGDNDLIMRARSGIALCYSLGGRFYEAEEILSGIRDTVHVSRRTLQSYYVARHRMNRELYALTEPGERRDLFRRREHYYAVSAAEISEDTFTSLYYGYMDAIVRKDWSEASTLCDSLLVSVPSDSHSYAKAANHKAQLEGKAGRPDEELAWFICSAMADIQSAVRDHGSLCAVSEELFNRGDVDRAMDYIRVAIRDTRFFNSPSRSWRDMAILPQIEAAYSERNARLHTMYIVLIVVILLFFVSAVAAGLYVLSRNRKLCAVQQTLRESNRQTRRPRPDPARDERPPERAEPPDRRCQPDQGGLYRGLSPDDFGIYQQTLGYVSVCQQDAARRPDRRTPPRIRPQQRPQRRAEGVLCAFDKTFLGLFPSFIDEMNGLLADEARTEGRHDGELTTVLRIYALIRLGITDTATIAALLHCSIRTVYNYRSFTQRHSQGPTSATWNSVCSSDRVERRSPPGPNGAACAEKRKITLFRQF